MSYYLSHADIASPYYSSGRPFSNLIDFLSRETADYNARYELTETEAGDFVLELPLPGFKKEEIAIEVEDRSLNIVAKNEKRSFSRSLDLLETIDGEQISATLENGLLRILLKRSELTKARRIEIK